MTRRDLSQLDPESRKPLMWIRRLTLGLVAAVAFLGAVVTVVALRGEDTRSIVTRVSECEHDAESDACQQVRREGVEAQTRELACITIRQGGYPCPRPGSKVARQAVQEASAGAPASGGEVAAAPPSGDGGLAPAGPGSAHPVAPQNADEDPAAVPGNPPAEAPAAPPIPAPVAVTPPTEPSPASPGPIRSAVEQVGGTVHETVCSLPLQLCP
jgi:hypothetical protein